MALTGWNYRKSHSITLATGSVSNYPVPIIVRREDGTSSGNTVYVGTKCNSDFSDIRFADSTGTELSHFISANDSTRAIFWVKLPSVTTSGITIYVYYGKSDAVSASDGANTFPTLFDHFASWSDEVWFYSGGSQPSCSGSNITVNNSTGYVVSETKWESTSIEAIVLATAPTTNYLGIGLLDYGGTSRGARFRYGSPTAAVFNTYTYFGSTTTNTNVGTISGSREWRVKFKSSTSVEFFIDGVGVATHSSGIGAGSGLCPHILPNTSTAGNIVVDAIAVRTIASTEPVDSTWGSEEDLAISKSFVSIYDLYGAVLFESIYNLSSSVQFESIFDIIAHEISFTSLYSMLCSQTFQTSIDGTMPISSEFRTRIDSVTGVIARFEEAF